MANTMSWVNKVLSMWRKIPHQYPKMCSQITASLFKVTFWYLFTSSPPPFFPVGPLSLMALFLEPSFHTVSNASESLESVLQPTNAKPHRANCTEIQGDGASTTCLLASFPSHPPCPLHPSCGNLSRRVTQSPWSSDMPVCQFCTNKIKIILQVRQIIILIRNFLWKHRIYKLPLDLQTWTKLTAPSHNMIVEWN